MPIRYGPIDLSAGPVNQMISPYPNTACIIVYNESPYFLDVQLDAGSSYPIPAGTADIVPVAQGFSGNVKLIPTTYLTTQGQAPSTVAILVSNGINDSVTRLYSKGLPTGFPLAFNRLFNLGNNINVGTSSSSVVNDGNTPPLQLIESTPAGSPGPTWYGDIDGTLVIQGLVGSILTQLLNIDAASSTVDIGALTQYVNVLGNLAVAQSLIVSSGQLGRVSAGDMLEASSTDIYLKSQAVNGTIHFRDGVGTEYGTFNSAGFNANNGVNFTLGRIKEITSNRFTFTAGAGGVQTINHGMGGTPNAVLICCADTTSTATNSVFNLTSTSFQVRSAVNNIRYQWLAYR